jgi:sporulation protein YlmC with PRC-barrel domain
MPRGPGARRVATEQEADMADAVPFTIGSDATCTDGPCGHVTRVVVDPARREITHLVIEPAHREGLGRLVPLELLEGGSPEVRLRCTLSEFENLPLAEETDFLPGGSGYTDYAAHEAYYWPYYGLGAVGIDPGTANASGIVTHDSLPVGEVGVRRGEPVHATDGEIGRVEGLVMEPAHHHVTHVLLQEGHLWGRKEVAIPISVVSTIDGGITVNLTKQEVEDLPPVGAQQFAG